MNRKKRMDTLRMIKLNHIKNDQRSATLQTALSEDLTHEIFQNDNLDNHIPLPIYVQNNLNSNSCLSIKNNSLSKKHNPNQNSQYSLCDLGKSINNAIGISNIYNSGSIKTATYVSPNGTLSRNDANRQELFSTNDHNESDTLQSLIFNNTSLKEQQINGLRNSKNFNNLIGLNQSIINHSQAALPNDYCSSGKIGALIYNENNDDSFIPNGKSHYLIPCNLENQYESNHPNQMVYFLFMFIFLVVTEHF